MLGICLIMRRRGCTGKIEDFIDLHALGAQPSWQWFDDITVNDFETRLAL
jgi:hypothetical protein